MSKTLPFLRSAVTALIVAHAAGSAQAVTVTTGSYANTGIGAEFVSPYDNLYIDGTSVDVAMTGMPVQLSLADYAFEVGPNCYACSLTPSFDALIDVTIDGVTRQLDLPYAWASSGPSDTLTFAKAAPIRFDFADSSSITIAVADLGMLSSTGDTVRGHLNATFTASAIPEPSTWVLTIAGLGLVVWVRRRRV